MLKTEMKTIVKEVKEAVPVKRICDICGEIVDESNWFRINTRHYDWGNDSVESLETRDACSPKCVLKFTEEYVSDSYNSKFNTKEIEIEHRRSLGNDDSEYSRR